MVPRLMAGCVCIMSQLEPSHAWRPLDLQQPEAITRWCMRSEQGNGERVGR